MLCPSNFSLLSSHFSLLSASYTQQPPGQQPDPLIVKIVEPENSDLIGLADVLWGSLGLTGVLVLGSVLAAAVFAGVLFWIRSRL